MTLFKNGGHSYTNPNVPLTFQRFLVVTGATARLDVPANNHHQSRLYHGKFPLRACRVSHKIRLRFFVPSGAALRFARETKTSFTEKTVLTLRMIGGGERLTYPKPILSGSNALRRTVASQSNNRHYFSNEPV